ncbi:MAG: manganese efflux pump MntP family protein [Pseudomonadota bacterium]
MNLITIIIIAIGLAMDAFAVSITCSCLDQHLKTSRALMLAAFFGGFQALMPILGWLGGSFLLVYISGFDHWLAFILLTIVGGKMIFESFKLDKDKKAIDLTNIYLVVILSIATSIDALVVGFSLSMLKVVIILPAIIIGIITFGFSLFGVFLGQHFGHLFESKIEFIGGLILIAIGLKILLEHLV